MKDGSLWAAVVADTLDDAKATVGRVARTAEARRSRVGGQLGGGRARLTWWVEVTSDYCRCGVQLTEPGETAAA